MAIISFRLYFCSLDNYVKQILLLHHMGYFLIGYVIKVRIENGNYFLKYKHI